MRRSRRIWNRQWKWLNYVLTFILWCNHAFATWTHWQSFKPNKLCDYCLKSFKTLYNLQKYHTIFHKQYPKPSIINWRGLNQTKRSSIQRFIIYPSYRLLTYKTRLWRNYPSNEGLLDFAVHIIFPDGTTVLPGIGQWTL